MSYVGMPVYAEPISAVTATPTVDLGERRCDEAGNQYVYAYNASNSLLEPGVPLVWGSNNTGYSFTLTNAASQTGYVAAVVHHSSVPTANYFWGMVRGLCRVTPDADQVSMNAGVEIVAGVDGGWTTKASEFVDGSGITITGATFAIGYGLTVESIVTGYGAAASFTSLGLNVLGRAWIRTVLG